MSTQHLEVLDSTLQKTHQWIDAIALDSHTDRHTAYQALRAVLQTLRDRLPAQEAAHFSAQLPLLIRGILYEGYRPAEVTITLSREEFLEKIRQKIVTARVVDPLALTRQVLATIDSFLCEGEIEKMGDVLQRELQDLLPRRQAAFVG
jgi:uncharacterized protein (DUF2267 family)